MLEASLIMSQPEETCHDDVLKAIQHTEALDILAQISLLADYHPMENAMSLGERLVDIEKLVDDFLETVKGGEVND